jgi:NADH-quinone oxidoreductase subunit L
MGGLAKKMPLTAMTFAAGWVAIIGVPLTSGYFSKEAILQAVLIHNPPLFCVLAFTAFLTTFYMTRLLILAFLGDPRDAHGFSHAQESGPSMLMPLVILAAFALFVGGLLHYNGNWERMLPSVQGAGGPEDTVLYVSIAALLSGLVLAASMYSSRLIDPGDLARRFPMIHEFMGRRYADELYSWAIRTFYTPFAARVARIDDQVIDHGMVDGVGRLGGFFSRAYGWFDDKIVDGILVDGFGALSQSAGSVVRRLQSGFAQFYLLIVALGLSLMVLWAARVLR